MSTTLDGPAGTDLDAQLAELTTRLGAEYGTGNEVGRMVEEERLRFADARIHSFLPILIERSVRSRLTRQAEPRRRAR